MHKPLTIAVDGPGSAGKGTVARGVARTLGFQYVDTGAMYRSVALCATRRDIAWEDEARLTALAQQLHFQFTWDGDILRVVVDGEDVTSAIRTSEIGSGASAVSKVPGVRTALLAQQRAMGAAGGVVMDGRDIGTVVLPDAELKIYLDASLEIRAHRRFEELLRSGSTLSFAEVRAALEARDKQDMERDVAPLKPAEDAVRLDTTKLTIHQAIEAVLELAATRQSGA